MLRKMVRNSKPVSDEQLRVTKMRFAGKRPNVDKSTIIYNDQITLSGIPDEAHEYMLGSRSAIEWILERYQVKKDKASGIVNDPNDWGLEHGNPRYILDLLPNRRVLEVWPDDVLLEKTVSSTREAVARCPECTQFFCRECITEHDDRVLCSACLKKLARVPLTRRPGFATFLPQGWEKGPS